jgi:hypothetical protein
VALGTANIAEMFYHEPIQAAIVGRCDEESLEIARLAYFWDLPVFIRIGTSAALNDRTFYPTVIHIPEISVITMSQALAQMLKKIGLIEVGFIYLNFKYFLDNNYWTEIARH